MRRRARTLRWTLGGVATVVSLVVGVLSLARDTTDYTIGNRPPEPSGGATAPAPSTATPSAPTQTEVAFLRPWNFGELNPILRVTERHPGECSGSSITSDDPEAVRCSADSVIYDPCWRQPTAGMVAVCPNDPWTRDVTLLDPVEPDAVPGDDGERPLGPTGTPWALELSNGRRCLFVSGVTTAVAGMRLNYQCDQDETEWGVGEVDRTSRLWRVLFSAPDTSDVTFVDVVRVWV